MHIAGKTGTTNDNYDRYFTGYTPYYCAAVWVGYKNNERISYSVNPAASLWRQVMEKVHADLPDKSFNRPSSWPDNGQCLRGQRYAGDGCLPRRFQRGPDGIL